MEQWADVLEHAPVRTGPQRLVLCYLLLSLTGQPLSLAEIADLSRLGRGTVQRSIKELEGLGLIRRRGRKTHRGAQLVSQYWLISPHEWRLSATPLPGHQLAGGAA